MGNFQFLRNILQKHLEEISTILLENSQFLENNPQIFWKIPSFWGISPKKFLQCVFVIQTYWKMLLILKNISNSRNEKLNGSVLRFLSWPDHDQLTKVLVLLGGCSSLFSVYLLISIQVSSSLKVLPFKEFCKDWNNIILCA